MVCSLSELKRQSPSPTERHRSGFLAALIWDSQEWSARRSATVMKSAALHTKQPSSQLSSFQGWLENGYTRVQTRKTQHLKIIPLVPVSAWQSLTTYLTLVIVHYKETTENIYRHHSSILLEQGIFLYGRRAMTQHSWNRKTICLKNIAAWRDDFYPWKMMSNFDVKCSKFHLHYYLLLLHWQLFVPYN